MASGGTGVQVKHGTPPWVGLAAAVWVQMAAGNAYTFPLYSPALESVLGYDQRQLAMLGVANDVGENFGLVAGVLCNSLPPWLVLLVGAAFCFLGFGTLWLAVSRTVLGMAAHPTLVCEVKTSGAATRMAAHIWQRRGTESASATHTEGHPDGGSGWRHD